MEPTELGAFLRSRREAVTPAEVGLPSGGRRRTPGLRRSELATLAGISVDYLVRLEQGRDRHPSAQVVMALVDALRLSEDDRLHLKILAGASNNPELCPSRPAAARAVRPSVRSLLDRLEPTPAVVLNHLTDVLAWTEAYAAIAGPLGILDGDAPNLLRYTFTHPAARNALPAWDRVADEQVAALRATLRFAEDEAVRLVEELLAFGGPEFGRRWEARPVQTKGTGEKHLRHPEVGDLHLAFETLQLPDADDQRLVVYLPADAATAAKLDDLAGRRPGALRAVADATA
jgi:transcriptional regulator with XRE-family HTH domain